MTDRHPSRRALGALWLATVTVLAACGGGGASPDPAAPTPAPSPAPGPAPGPAPAPATTGWQVNQPIGNTRDLFTTDIYATPATLDDNDRGWVAWGENASGGCSGQLWVARLDAGTWSAPQNLAHGATGTGATADVLSVNIAASSNGAAALVWTQRYWSGATCNAIDGSEVWIRRYVSGAWLAPERVSAAQDGNFFATDAKVAIDSAGRITVAWVQQTATGSERPTPYARRYESGAWQAPRRLNAGDRSVFGIEIGQAGNGDVIFAWTQDTNLYDPNQSGGGPSQPAIWSARYVAASATWPAAARVGSALSGFDGEARPHLAVGAGGHAVLVWERGISGDHPIYGARFDPATSTWGAPIELVDGQAGAANFARVAVNASGQAQIAWLVSDAVSGNDGYTTRWNAGSNPQAAVTFETSDVEVGLPEVGIDASGRAVLVWPQVQNILWGLRARHVLATGMENDVVLQAGSGSARAAVAVNARGQAIVAHARQSYDASVPRFTVGVHAALYLP